MTGAESGIRSALGRNQVRYERARANDRDRNPRRGGIVLKIYDQGGVLREMVIADTTSNRLFVVWCRKFDRA